METRTRKVTRFQELEQRQMRTPAGAYPNLHMLSASYVIKVDDGMFNFVSKLRTSCCALSQLSCDDSTEIEALELAIAETKNAVVDPSTRDGGERALFVVTIEDVEENLEKRLVELGFEKIYTFHRRSYHVEDSMLNLWIISW